MKIFCSLRTCKNNTEGYEYHLSSRCPLCDAPAGMPKSVQTMSNSDNFFSKYLSDITKLDALPKRYSEISKQIGNTPIMRQSEIEQYTKVSAVYLKVEFNNPSGSFKDRGTLTAITGHASGNSSNLIIGTVSTGNMAISTIYIASKLKVPNFVVIPLDIDVKKLNILRRIGGTHTNIFLTSGDYSKFHEITYGALGELRGHGLSIYAELTDDFYRTVGYSTIAAEIINGLDRTGGEIPHNVVLCGASGALYLAVVWYFEQAYKAKKINRMPRVHLVQELGGDPIGNSYRKYKTRYKPLLKLKKGLVASAINVRNSRSGVTVLQNINDSRGRNSVVSVSTEEITKASQLLNALSIDAQVSSTSVVAGLKKLKEEHVIGENETALLILTGKTESKRELKASGQPPNIVLCELNNLRSSIINTYLNEYTRLNT